jgi:hypothetical protein
MYHKGFRIKKTYFAQVSNHALRDKNLSLKAKGLYALIQSYLTIEGFTLYKNTLRKDCVEGEMAFENAWKELKRTGYLIQHKVQNEKGSFFYEYELLDEVSECEKLPLQNQTHKTEVVDKALGGNVPIYSNTNINNTNINNNQLVSQTDEQTDIQNIIEQSEVYRYEDADLQENIKDTIKDAYIDGTTRHIINKLKLKHIDIAIAKYRQAQEQQDIKNPKLYFKKCLLSAIEECGLRGLF